MDFENLKDHIAAEVEDARAKIAKLDAFNGHGHLRAEMRDYAEILGEEPLFQETMTPLERFSKIGEHKRRLEVPVEGDEEHPALREAKIRALERMLKGYTFPEDRPADE
jgi:hypothetical protein